MSKRAHGLALLFCLASITPALSASTPMLADKTKSPTIYALSDAGTIIVMHNGKSHEIAGRHTRLHSTISIRRQALGDLVVSNRETDDAPGSIVTLPDGKGDVAAKYVIKCKDFSPWGIGLDADSNIWTTDYEANTVRAFAATATGCPKPLVTISGAHTGLSQPENVAIDHKGRIVVADYLNGIYIFAPGANGDVSPVATLTNSHVMNAHLEGMTIDAKDNIWVTSYVNGAVYEFDAKAKDGDEPRRILQGPQTRIGIPVGIALDKTGNIYVADYSTHAILVFPPDADGNTAPIAEYDLGFMFGVAVR